MLSKLDNIGTLNVADNSMINMKNNFFYPRPFENNGNYVSPLLLWNVTRSSVLPYSVFPVQTEGAYIPGPFFISSTNESTMETINMGFENIESALNWGRDSTKLIEIYMTARSFIVIKPVVIDRPTLIQSFFVPSVHGNVDPILILSNSNPCQPTIFSYWYMLSLANINVKIAKNGMGILYFDDMTNETDLAASIGDECSVYATGSYVNEIVSFEQTFNQAYFDAMWNDTTNATKELSSNVVFQGGKWAILSLVRRPLQNITIQSNTFVGQSYYGLWFHNASLSLNIIDNTFTYIGMNDSSSWSEKNGSVKPQHMNQLHPFEGEQIHSNSIQAGLVLSGEASSVNLFNNRFHEIDAFGVILMGGSLKASCNSFSLERNAGVYVGCDSDTFTPSSKSECDNNGALLSQLKEIFEASITNSSTTTLTASSITCQLIVTINNTIFSNDQAFEQIVSINPLLNYTLNQLKLQNSSSNVVRERAVPILKAAIASIYEICLIEINSYSRNPNIGQILSQSHSQGSFDFEGLFRNNLLIFNACLSVGTRINTQSFSSLCTENNSFQSVIISGNVFYQTPRIFNQSGNVLVISTDNLVLSSVGSSVPFELKIDVNGPIAQTDRRLSITDQVLDEVSSLVVFDGTPVVGLVQGPQNGLCTDSFQAPSLWRSFVLWITMPLNDNCVGSMIGYQGKSSNVLTISSDIKHGVMSDSHKLDWHLNPSEALQKAGVNCSDLIMIVDEGYSSEAPLQVIEPYETADDCDLKFKANSFIGQYFVVDGSKEKKILYVDCGEGNAFPHVDQALIYSSIQEAVSAAYEDHVLFETTVVVAGSCYECLYFQDMTYADISIVSARFFDFSTYRDLPSFLVHPPSCFNNVEFVNCSDISIAGIDFRSDLSQRVGLLFSTRSISSDTLFFDNTCGQVLQSTTEDRYHRSIFIISSNNVTIQDSTFYQLSKIEAVGVIFSEDILLKNNVFFEQNTAIHLYVDPSLDDTRVIDRFNFDLSKNNALQSVLGSISIDNNTIIVSSNGIVVGLCEHNTKYVTPTFELIVSNNQFVSVNGKSISFEGVTFLEGGNAIISTNGFHGSTLFHENVDLMILENSRLDYIVNELRIRMPTQSNSGGEQFEWIRPFPNTNSLVFNDDSSSSDMLYLSIDGARINSINNYYGPYSDQSSIVLRCSGCMMDGDLIKSGSLDIGNPLGPINSMSPILIRNARLTSVVAINVTGLINPLVLTLQGTTFNPKLFYSSYLGECQQSIADVVFIDSVSIDDVHLWSSPPSPSGFPWINAYIHPRLRNVYFCKKHEVYTQTKPGYCQCEDIGSYKHVFFTPSSSSHSSGQPIDVVDIEGESNFGPEEVEGVSRVQSVDSCPVAQSSDISDGRQVCRKIRLSEFEDDTSNTTSSNSPTPTPTPTPHVNVQPEEPPIGFWAILSIILVLLIIGAFVTWYYWSPETWRKYTGKKEKEIMLTDVKSSGSRDNIRRRAHDINPDDILSDL